MNKILIIIFAIIVSGYCKVTAQVKAEPQPFFVMELFSSEECSSCPNADTYLYKFVTHKLYEDKNVIALIEPVSYWAYLGWTDIYAKKLFADRHRKYAQVINGSNPATPQFFINGERYLPNYTQMPEFADAALAIKPDAGIAVGLKGSPDASMIEVEYDIMGVEGNYNLIVALIEDDIYVTPDAGENMNRQLHHYRLAREFKSIAIEEMHGTVELDVPADLVKENAGVLAFVQNPTTLEIPCATKGFRLLEPNSISEEAEGNNIKIYPNPASHYLKIESTEYINSEIEIYNILGEKAHEAKIVNNISIIDLKNLSPGTYVLRISNGKSVVIKRFEIIN